MSSMGTVKRTDADVEMDVREEIFWDGRIDAREVAVKVRDGVVTLRGTVGSFGEKRAAGAAARRVVGIVDVVDELEVRVLDRQARHDAELRGQVLQVLAWNAFVPDTVDATVDDGLVTLRGTARHHFERAEAEAAVRNLNGVADIVNGIALDTGPTAGEVNDRIEQAFRRNAALDARDVTVESAGGKVTLRGAVRSWVEHDAALEAAWAAPGVTSVDDRLELAYP
jgi:osmotically-inducible protein OsmY